MQDSPPDTNASSVDTSRRPEVNWVEIDGTVVAVDPRHELVHRLEGASAIIWQLLDGSPVDDIPTLLADKFGITVELARRDLDAALEQMASAGILDDRGQPAAHDPDR